MSELHARIIEKKRFIEDNGYTYVCKWECDFKHDMAYNANMKQCVDSLEIVSPLEPREAFFGGRTETFTLYEKASENKEIKYNDVTSLYPWVNKTGKIPLGHPKVITENFDDVSCYEGLVKCKVLPPRGLHIPVLPVMCNGKLIFSLCRMCSETFQQTPCNHSVPERAFVGTWVTDEIKEAISQGYVIQNIYEVWPF